MSVNPADFVVGTPVHLNFRKWDDREHWQSDGVLLGEDEYGVWLGFRAGCRHYRPGHSFTASPDHVIAIPRNEGWVGRLYDTPTDDGVRIYVDLSSTTTWTASDNGLVATLIDLDLDVIENGDGYCFIDDEDEFIEHQSLFGYPPEVIARVRADADALLEEVHAHRPPFDDDTTQNWLGTLRSL
ncbi:DUF402 domain-containing protein [Branchiibius sp. NY16-3462-2]|uniref:DUF402 domain-containing protein n=1 Tax=Branchiibius sp. NY16-3462-2 TaxID=1807500 RepID=UPI0007936304|nr:DUF402 domain-containing protein [Branchiibius sp. NY16-3462-2]KYH43173.1 hypothetical protein AZH51_12505 [Branchiibius sp. NY16-3462-2]